MVHTDIPEAPWYVVESEDKRRARINMIAHLLSTLPYHEVTAAAAGAAAATGVDRATNGRRGTRRPTYRTTPPRSTAEPTTTESRASG